MANIGMVNDSVRNRQEKVTGDKIPSGYSKGRVQNYTPEMMNLHENQFQHLGPDSYLSRLAGGDQTMFDEMEAPAMRQFQGLQGQLASRFSGMGMGGRKSSGFQNTSNQAASDFAQDLQSKRMGLRNQAIKDLMGMSNELLNQKPYQNYLVKKQHKQPFWKKALGIVSPLGGDIAEGDTKNTENFFNLLSKFSGIGNKMIEIIEENRKPTFGENFGNAFSGLVNSASNFYDKKQENETKEKRRKAVEELYGSHIADLDPDLQKLYIGEKLKGHSARELEELKSENERRLISEKSTDEGKLENKNYNTIKSTFGERFADVWNSATEGGKTELLKSGIEGMMRGENINDILQNVSVPQQSQEFQSNENLPQIKLGQTGELDKFNWPNFSKRPLSYTSKEWNEEKKTWRTANSPIYLENKNKINALSRDELGIKKIDKLNKSKKLPEGFERSLINPETGEFYGIAQLAELVSPEAQEWVKEISRFGNRAKDAFGSRVTNFDLQTYMKQFPGLLNTEEGRSRIINMMKINNKLDKLYESSLQKVYNKYGLNGIPPEKAEELAQGFIKDETERLRNEYVSLDEKNQLDEESNGDKLSGKMIDVIGPDGQEYEVDQREVELLPEGFKIK